MVLYSTVLVLNLGSQVLYLLTLKQENVCSAEYYSILNKF